MNFPVSRQAAAVSLALALISSTAIAEVADTVVVTATRTPQLAADLIADTCVDEACCWGYLAGKPGVTDSPKGAYYMETAGIRMAVRDTATCIRWAKQGRVC